MADPFEVLNLPPDSNDDAIRRRYLELVKAHPPDRDPERFAAVRAAFDALKDIETRIASRLFADFRGESIDSLLQEVRNGAARKRLTLQQLLALAKSS